MKRFFAKLLFKGGVIENNIILLGLDAAGKTTIIYKMKLGEVITTIPTIGFNLEIIEYKGLSIKCWDVGGCDKIRPLWRHYFEGMDAFIYVVDSNDRERISEAHTELHTMMKEIEALSYPVPVLIFANKQDLPNAMSPKEIADKLELSKIPNAYIQASCATSGDGLYEGFDWLSEKYKVLRGVNGNAPISNSNHNNTPNPNTNSNNNNNNNNNANTTPPPSATAPPANGARPPPQPPFKSPSDALTNTEFLAAFENYTLPCWDHKTHIRVAYLNLKRYGRREGVRKIRKGLQDFIANSTITNKNRFHETMTYFWIQMTHYAMSCSRIPLQWEPYDDVNGLPEFDAFLEKNVQLMNGGLFLEYYTRDLMLNNMESRQQFVLPDVKPLPNLIETTNHV